jgi:sterol desaturase/sphingolipid hydroxylase (fatty acid hydroxylase superfamily)
MYVQIVSTHIDGHGGYDFRLSPVQHLPIYTTGPYHDYHHEYFNSNFSGNFWFWDTIFGTYDGQDVYKKYLEKR